MQINIFSFLFFIFCIFQIFAVKCAKVVTSGYNFKTSYQGDIDRDWKIRLSKIEQGYTQHRRSMEHRPPAKETVMDEIRTVIQTKNKYPNDPNWIEIIESLENMSNSLSKKYLEQQSNQYQQEYNALLMATNDKDHPDVLSKREQWTDIQDKLAFLDDDAAVKNIVIELTWTQQIAQEYVKFRDNYNN